MSQKQFDVIVYIGRFSPLHSAHLKTIQNASEIAEQVIVLVGSSNQPRTIKNPFTFTERYNMIRAAVEYGENVYVHPIEDFPYNDQIWASQVQSIVKKTTFKDAKIGIIGHEKDSSSFYLKMFPQWEFVSQPLHEPLSATDIRDLYLKENANMHFIEGVVPETTSKFLQRFKSTGYYNDLIEEKQFIDSYKKKYAAYPYAPTFVTVDACVIQSGHVLLIQRRSSPGKGLWALPGGFLDADSDRNLEDAMIRELFEETKIKVPEKVLRGSIVGTKMFDANGRSLRGRTLTNAYAIGLNDDSLPKIKASDDAVNAKWVPIGEIRPEEMFEDHVHIIQWALTQMK